MNDRITINPEVLAGKPLVAGTRMSVEFVVGLLAQGWTVEDVLKEYDQLTCEDIQACRAYSRRDFERYLAAVPHAEPDETDRMP
jgi:uncharacterized protein (DUF433 family)